MKASKSIIRIVLAATTAMALQALSSGCSSDQKSAAGGHHPFQSSADNSVDVAKITVHNTSKLTQVVNFSGPGQTRAGHSLAPGESWTQLLPPGNYSYSAQATNSAETAGSVEFSAKMHYVWTLK